MCRGSACSGCMESKGNGVCFGHTPLWENPMSSYSHCVLDG